MGFFQDLKEDLSQAVNELIPDDKSLLDKAVKEEQIVDSVEEQSNLDEIEAEEWLDDEELDELVSEAIGEKIEVEDEEIEEAKKKLIEEQIRALVEVENEKERQLAETNGVTQIEEGREIPDAVVADMLKSEGTVEEVLGKVNAESQEKGYNGLYKGNNETKEQGSMSEQTMKLAGVATDENSIITSGMTITGNITSKGSLEVEGTIIGDVETLGKLDVKGTIKGKSKAAEIYAECAKINGDVHSEGTIKIGQSSVIIGNIFGKNAVIAGAVKGDIDVQGPVVLDTSAIVMGNIKSKSVQINNGAVIEGLCSQCYADVSPTSFFDEYKG